MITSMPSSRARSTSVDGGDPAVDREQQADAGGRDPLERLDTDAVALLEAARQVPLDVGAELLQHQDGERRRADAVDVVVAVDADPLAGGDRLLDPVAGRLHVAQQERVVGGAVLLHERARALRRRRARGGSAPRRWCAERPAPPARASAVVLGAPGECPAVDPRTSHARNAPGRRSAQQRGQTPLLHARTCAVNTGSDPVFTGGRCAGSRAPGCRRRRALPGSRSRRRS